MSCAGSGSKCTCRMVWSLDRRLQRTWLPARCWRSTYPRRRNRSLGGQHTPRSVAEMREASLAGSIQVMTSTVATRNPAANIAVVASGRKEASRLLKKSGNPPIPSFPLIPSFPRRRESIRLSGRVVTPRTKIGEAWCMGTIFSTLLRLLQKPHVRHSREGGNLFSISAQDWIPAFAGMTRTGRSRVCATASARADPARTRRSVAGSGETIRPCAEPVDRRRVSVRYRFHDGSMEDQ